MDKLMVNGHQNQNNESILSTFSNNEEQAMENFPVDQTQIYDQEYSCSIIKETEDENLDEDYRKSLSNLIERKFEILQSFTKRPKAISNLPHRYKRSLSNVAKTSFLETMIDKILPNAMIKNKTKLILENNKIFKFLLLYSIEHKKNDLMQQNNHLLQENILEEQIKINKLDEEIIELKNRLILLKEQNLQQICLHGKCLECLEEQAKNNNQEDEDTLYNILPLEEETKENSSKLDDSTTLKGYAVYSKTSGSNKKRFYRSNSLTKTLISTTGTTTGTSPSLGKKSQVISQRTNNALKIVQKLKTKKVSKFNNIMPVKQVLKQITNIYEERVIQTKENTSINEEELPVFVLNIFINNFGFRNIAEQKFIIFIASVKKYLHIVRINLFARFMGLLEDKANYTGDEFNKYIEGIDHIKNSKLATTINNNEIDAKYYVPFLRLLDYVKAFSEGKLAFDEYTEFKREFEIIKEVDLKNINRLGIIDVDIAMTKIIAKYRLIFNRTKQFVINAFKAADLDGNKVCNKHEFLLLYQYIEPDKYDKEFCVGIFNSYAELNQDGERVLSFDKFTLLCIEYQLFNDQQQDNFLGITSKEDIENQYNELKIHWKEKVNDINNKMDILENFKQKDKEYWLQILKCFEERIKNEILEGIMCKPILIAFKILCSQVETLEKQQIENKQNLY